MSATLLIVPGSPALVPALSPAHAPSTRIADAVRDAAAAPDIAEKPVDIVCPLDEDEYTARTGSFAAWGAPQVTAGGGNHLGELIVRHLLGARDYRRPARAEIGQLDPDALTVVVADGPAGLTPRAPLALLDDAPATHEGLQAFVAGSGELPGLHGGVVKPALWHELARLAPRERVLLDADDSLGVGRYVGVWRW